MRAPLPEPARLLATSRTPHTLLLAAVVLLTTLLAGCEEDTPAPTAAREPDQPASTVAEQAVQATTSVITALRTSGLPLPIQASGATSSPQPLFWLTQTGTGPNGQFHISSTSNSSAALRGLTRGTGRAGEFLIENSSNSSPALFANTFGTGPALQAIGGAGSAGLFESGTGLGVVAITGTGVALDASVFGTSGIGGSFSINNSSDGAPVLKATTVGTGPVLRGTSKGGPGLEVTSGGGSAGDFELDNTSNSEPALFVKTRGTGPAGSFLSTHAGSSSPLLYATTTSQAPTALFETGNTASGSPVLSVKSIGFGTSGGSAGQFENTSFAAVNPALAATTNGSGPALQATTKGTGWAGIFQAVALGNGVQITTLPGQVGLQVLGGTKSAVVATPSGARALYTEESSEVWFTDYGFGRLTNGRARVLIDPTFAQTINTDVPYHVFVQAYGDANLYVRERTSLGFEVVFRGGTDRDAEFSYRVVAKRRGFERMRLEPAPWADHTAEEAAALKLPAR